LHAINGGIVVIHCVCHRLQLAAVDAAKNIPAIKKFKEDLVELCKYVLVVATTD
jgi:hypothetical protein